MKKEPFTKTRQSKFLEMFLEMFPNADISYEGYLNIDPCDVDKSLFDDETCMPRDCEECKKEYWLAEVPRCYTYEDGFEEALNSIDIDGLAVELCNCCLDLTDTEFAKEIIEKYIFNADTKETLK